MTSPSSQSARPPTLCPPPRIAVSRLFARPKVTAAITSAMPEQRAISLGCLLMLAFQIWAGFVITEIRRLENLAVKCRPEGIDVDVGHDGSEFYSNAGQIPI